MHYVKTNLLLLAGLIDLVLSRPGQTVFSSSGTEIMTESQWNFDDLPSVNSTSHLVFGTVDSLLQHWPNTRYRNGMYHGHTIIPATIPVGTLLYHGTSREIVPDVPEWVATDPEHSFLFCRTLSKSSGCWQLTMVTSRPLKVLHFDGSSAAKMLGGPMDTQDLTLWGKVRPEWTFREKERIVELCKWGQPYGLDGFLRMEMNFEIMLCDFSSGVQTVSFLNLAPTRGGPPKWNPPPKEDLRAQLSPSHPPPSSPMFYATVYRVMESGSWHNHFPGDTRIELDYSRLISLYDTATFPSLQSSRFNKKRLEHRLDGISGDDANMLQARIKKALTGNAQGSGVNWKVLMRVITNRYAERLEVLQYILNSTDPAIRDANSTVQVAHRHVRSILTPYTLYSATPPTNNNDLPKGGYPWASPVFELCATTHTTYMEGAEFLSLLTPSEVLILDSIKGVTKEICRVLVGIWAEGMEYGLADPTDKKPPTAFEHSAEIIGRWSKKVENLMAWLDWSHWLRCRPACSYEEMCYLPTWPFLYSKRPFPKADYSQDIDGEGPDESNWADPQPMCIRRVEPFVDEEIMQ
ncbi:hypothetical protein JR316_0006395 [Psilocybe cubensis]|uniref:Uncharacterized protein n=2 Tax=Psilocybe cubensis TaxID=181762 RepID=A0ACB8H3T7_PSICU|nr:hypothetical protein JR316_0006395 [Psilocybe cubensis]KAH9481865.1 hypothetical protein JR316_0006395 [Psilocybe cubensis]